jgi:hypothetical protein
MIERDMEDLIAAYSADFFPRQKLTLKGRQNAFFGVGRFDLLFEDEFQTNILMELKARPAKYEDATQLAKYKEELERRGEANILMWLVAPQISSSIREFLERIGIEYSEIHHTEFRRIAAKHGTVIRSEACGDTAAETGTAATTVGGLPKDFPGTTAVAQVAVGPVVTRPSKFRWKAYGYDLALLNPEDFDRSKFQGFTEFFEQAVPSRRNAAVVAELRAWAADLRHSRWPHGSNCSLLCWVTTTGWRSAVPHAQAIWTYMFGVPAPTWYVWRQAEKKYVFDTKGWAVWYESLSRSLRAVEAIYKEHNAHDARSWPVDLQCQCKDCQSYRKAHPSTSSL